MTGSNQIVHWTSETWWEWSEIAGSTQGYPPAADSVGCQAGRRTCSKLETRTEELCDQVNQVSLHIVGVKWQRSHWLTHCWHGTWRSTHWRATKPVIKITLGHQCSETMLTGESRSHISAPLGFWSRVPHGGKLMVSSLDQWDMVRMK
jgi:hypothetical protein